MRTAQITRKTKETDISLSFSLDGGEVKISTGIGFLIICSPLSPFTADSSLLLMLKAILRSILITQWRTRNRSWLCYKAVARRYERYKSLRLIYIPMDEALAHCALDISNRPFLVFNADFAEEKCGDYETCCTVEFFRAVAVNAGITLHLNEIYGSNSHHIIEALFKAFGHALGIASAENSSGVLSTKGVL